MGREELIRSLDAMHKELSGEVSVDGETREKLRALGADIERLLSGDSAGAEVHRISSGLREMVEQFEASHPKLTSTMSHVADALSSLGI